MSSKYLFLGHKYAPFDKVNISQTAKEYGFTHRDALESHLWVYELYYQIQKRVGESCVLKGGACAQLYLPLNVQRCTLDLDLSTSLNPRELNELLQDITDEFNSFRFYSQFREYFPRRILSEKELIPMKTFLFTLPFIYKKGKNTGYPDIKMDFVFSPPDEMPSTYLDNGTTIGLKLKYSPYCLTHYSIICNKLLTFAANSIGLDNYKVESFYKNIYDLYQLINEYNNPECFKAISAVIDDNIQMEFHLKNQIHQDSITVIKDILSKLQNIFIFDLLFDEIKPSKRLIDFQERCLQSSIRQDLNNDTWSIMSMYLYVWTYALKKYIKDGDYSSISLINEVLENYDYYLSLEKKPRRMLLREYKKSIFEKDNRLNLLKSMHALRIIYLYHIYNKLPIQ